MSKLSSQSVRVLPLVIAFATVVTVFSGCGPVPWANTGPSGPATVTGAVTSDRGAVLADAAVLLHGQATTRNTRTDINGRFVFPNVPLGQFTVSVSAAGYRGAKQKVNVEKEGTGQVNVRLKM